MATTLHPDDIKDITEAPEILKDATDAVKEIDAQSEEASDVEPTASDSQSSESVIATVAPGLPTESDSNIDAPVTQSTAAQSTVAPEKESSPPSTIKALTQATESTEHMETKSVTADPKTTTLDTTTTKDELRAAADVESILNSVEDDSLIKSDNLGKCHILYIVSQLIASDVYADTVGDSIDEFDYGQENRGLPEPVSPAELMQRRKKLK